MSAKRDAALPSGNVDGIQVRQFGTASVTGLEQFADPPGHGAHRDRVREEVIKDFFVEVVAVAPRAVVIGVLIDDVAGLLTDTCRVAEVRVVRERMIAGLWRSCDSSLALSSVS